MKIQDVIEGLQIIEKNHPGGGIEAGHDEIMAGHHKNLPEEDLKRLEELTWFWNDEWDSWMTFC